MPSYTSSSIEVFVFRREAGRPQYLLLRAAAEEFGAGSWWQLVAEIGEGETAAACAVRTTREGTGQPVQTLWALDHMHTWYDAAGDTIHLTPVFLAEISEKSIRTTVQYAESRWVTYEQAMDMLLQPGHRLGLTRAHEDVGIALDRGSLYRIPAK